MSARRAVRNPLFARVYERVSAKTERAGIAEHRDELLDGLSGRVVELGAGNGMNFRHYPSTVTQVVAVEPEPYLRGRAEDAATDARVPIHVVDGIADALPFDDGAFDAAVASLVLCTVPDQPRALAELHRVIRPGGELRSTSTCWARTRSTRGFSTASVSSGPGSPAAATQTVTRVKRSPELVSRSRASGASRSGRSCLRRRPRRGSSGIARRQ